MSILESPRVAGCGGPCTQRGGGPTSDVLALRGQLRRDGVELPGDRERQSAERHNDAERDHGQDDAVLGHRLTLLALCKGAKKGIPVADCHAVTPPFALTGMKGGSVKSSRSRRVSSSVGSGGF